MNPSKKLKWYYVRIVFWMIIFIIHLIAIITNHVNVKEPWISWAWEVISLIQVYVIFQKMKKMKNN